jgi:hypothetical protein
VVSGSSGGLKTTEMTDKTGGPWTNFTVVMTTYLCCSISA